MKSKTKITLLKSIINSVGAILTTVALSYAPKAVAAEGRSSAGTNTATSASDALANWLVGQANGVGKFRNKLTGVSRSFNVRISGSRTGGLLTLREDVDYSDGERDQKVWYLTQVGPKRFVGRRSDVVGTADGYEDDRGRLHLKYAAINDGHTLDFDDVLELKGGGTLVNTIYVSYLYLPVGEAKISFKK